MNVGNILYGCLGGGIRTGSRQLGMHWAKMYREKIFSAKKNRAKTNGVGTRCAIRNSVSRLVVTLLVFSAAQVHGSEDRYKLLVENATLITVAPGAEPFVGYLLVNQDGRIAAIGPGAAPRDVKASKRIDADGAVVAPGFISAHSHIYMSPLRGLGHDQNLYGWFKAWDHYLRHTTAEDVYWFTLHGSVDFLRNGITTAYDFTYPGVVEELTDDPSQAQKPGHFKPGPVEENQIRAKIDAGMRFINSPWLSEIGTDADIRARFEKLLAWSEPHMQHPLFLKMAISGAQQFAPTPQLRGWKPHLCGTTGL